MIHGGSRKKVLPPFVILIFIGSSIIIHFGGTLLVWNPHRCVYIYVDIYNYIYICIYLSIISININMCPKFVDFVFVSTPQRKSHPSTAITSPGKWVGSPTFANKWIRSPLEKQEETSRNTKNVLTCPVNHGVVYVDRSWSYFSTMTVVSLGRPGISEVTTGNMYLSNGPPKRSFAPGKMRKCKRSSTVFYLCKSFWTA